MGNFGKPPSGPFLSILCQRTMMRGLTVGCALALLIVLSCGGESGESLMPTNDQTATAGPEPTIATLPTPTSIKSSTPMAPTATAEPTPISVTKATPVPPTSTPVPTATPVSPPVAQFEMDANAGQAPFSPIIRNLSLNAASYEWDFGDGFTSGESIPSHAYTKTGSFIITLIARVQNQSDSFNQTVSVESGALVSVVAEPAQSSLTPGGSQQFSAEGFDEFSNKVSGVRFSWGTSEGSGTIDERGLFSAPTTAGNYERAIMLTGQTDGGLVEISVDLVVNPGPPARVTLEPSPIIMDIGASQTIEAQVFDEFANQIPSPLIGWTAAGAVGTIDSDGVLTSGTKAGLFQEAISVNVVQGSASVSTVADVVVRPASLA